MIVLNYGVIMTVLLTILVNVLQCYEHVCLEHLDNNYYSISFMISHIWLVKILENIKY